MRYEDRKKAFRDENEYKAFDVLMYLFSAQADYQVEADNYSFGSAIELFSNDFIDEHIACALGCPQMKSFSGRICKGDNAPYFGYRFHLSVIKGNNQSLAEFKFPDFKLVAFHTIDQLNYRSFFIDSTGIIRFSDNPEILANSTSPEMDWTLYNCTNDCCL